MEKMNENEIIKALEFCGGKTCSGCPFQDKFGDDSPCANLERLVLDLINRQKAEIEQKDTEIDILIRKKETLKDELAEKQAEIERLTAEANRYKRYYFNHEYDQLKAEAYKEFAEMVKARAEAYTVATAPTFEAQTTYKITERKLDHILLKLTEKGGMK